MYRQVPLSPEQKEQARHGESMFPLQKYITLLSYIYPAVAAHWHEEAEFTMITGGRCTYQIQFDSFEVTEGDILFLPPSILHSLSVETGGFMKSETYVFHMNFLGSNSADVCSVRYLKPITQQTLILPAVIHPDHPAYRELRDIFSDMNTAYTRQLPGYELKLKALLLKVLSALIPFGRENASRPRIETDHIQKIRQILDYIGEHYSEDLSIARLAERCYFSEYYFMRFFKKYVGISCLEYIKNLRLEKAAGLLAGGETSVLEASLSAGFSNLSYFYREFKKKYGMTPKKYIESLSSGGITPGAPLHGQSHLLC